MVWAVSSCASAPDDQDDGHGGERAGRSEHLGPGVALRRRRLVPHVGHLGARVRDFTSNLALSWSTVSASCSRCASIVGCRSPRGSVTQAWWLPFTVGDVFLQAVDRELAAWRGAAVATLFLPTSAGQRSVRPSRTSATMSAASHESMHGGQRRGRPVAIRVPTPKKASSPATLNTPTADPERLALLSSLRPAASRDLRTDQVGHLRGELVHQGPECGVWSRCLGSCVQDVPDRPRC